MNNNSWNKTAATLPPMDTEIETKVDDEGGVRNRQRLVKINDYWFIPKESTCVYYTPTHWRYVA